MSTDIDLNIDNLHAFNVRLRATVKALNTSRDSCSRQVTNLNQVWDSPSYGCFRDEVYFIINGVFLQSIDDTGAFQNVLFNTEKKAVELRAKANGFLNILSSGGGISVRADRSILFHDASQASTVRSTIASAESTASALSSGFEDIELALSRMRTKRVLVDGESISYYTTELKGRLRDLETSIGEFESGLSEMDTILNGLADGVARITGLRFAGSTDFSSLIVDGKIADPEIALLLFKTPKHLLSDHEKALLKELTDAGCTLEGLMGRQGVSVFAGLEMADGITTSSLSTGNALYSTTFKKGSKTLTRFAKGVPGLGVVLSVADALYTYNEVYETSPELATSRRTSDAQVEGIFSGLEGVALSLASYILTEAGAAIGASFGAAPGAAVGGAIGSVVGTAGSIIYVLNADEIQAETIRKKDSDGTSLIDDWKDWRYDVLWDRS